MPELPVMAESEVQAKGWHLADIKPQDNMWTTEAGRATLPPHKKKRKKGIWAMKEMKMNRWKNEIVRAEELLCGTS